MPAQSNLAPPPQDIKQVQRFLSIVNFYRCFLPNCALVLRPLTDLLKGEPKTLELTAGAHEAFQNAKRLLATSMLLTVSIPPCKLNFLLPLAPPLLILTASCSKTWVTIGNHLVFSQES
jgi:hypothetical protein